MEPGCLTSLRAGTRNQGQVTFCLLSVFFSPSPNGLSSLLSFESAPTLLSVCEHSYSRQSNMIFNKEEIVPQSWARKPPPQETRDGPNQAEVSPV